MRVTPAAIFCLLCCALPGHAEVVGDSATMPDSVSAPSHFPAASLPSDTLAVDTRSAGALPDTQRAPAVTDTNATTVAVDTLTRPAPPIVHEWLFGRDTVDSAKAASLKRTRNVRRVVFGILSAGFAVAGMVANADVRDRLDAEESALKGYQAPGLSQDEYDARWQQYQDALGHTDGSSFLRNASYGLSAAFGIAFMFSIWF
jgi:hypothetical protein